jgi:hypothetical protein
MDPSSLGSRGKDKAGGDVVFVRLSAYTSAVEWPFPDIQSIYVLLWFEVSLGDDVIFVGALHHPLKHRYAT